MSCVQARDRLAALQKALATSQARVKETLSLSAESEELEAAVCRAAQRVAALKEALAGDEAALSARLAVQASRLNVRPGRVPRLCGLPADCAVPCCPQILRNDAEAAKAALQAATMEREAAEQGLAVDEAELKRLKAEQVRLLEQAAQVCGHAVFCFFLSPCYIACVASVLPSLCALRRSTRSW